MPQEVNVFGGDVEPTENLRNVPTQSSKDDQIIEQQWRAYTRARDAGHAAPAERLLATPAAGHPEQATPIRQNPELRRRQDRDLDLTTPALRFGAGQFLALQHATIRLEPRVLTEPALEV